MDKSNLKLTSAENRDLMGRVYEWNSHEYRQQIYVIHHRR